MLAPDGAGYERLIVVGVGPVSEREELDFAKLGGAIAGRLGHGRSADVILALPDGEIAPTQAADVALGPGMSVVPTVRIDPQPSLYERLRRIL